MPGHALFITHTHPLPDLDGAPLRALRLMQMLRELGWQVTNLSAGRAFHPAYEARGDEARALLSAGGIQATGPTAPLVYLAAHGTDFDLIVLAVTPGQADFLSQMRQAAPNALLIYDTIELTFLSMHCAGQIQRNERLLQQAHAVASKQLAIAATADVTWVVTDEEKTLLEQLCPQARVHVISNVHSVTEKAPKLDGRRDLLFVGNYVRICLIATPPAILWPTSGLRCAHSWVGLWCALSACPCVSSANLRSWVTASPLPYGAPRAGDDDEEQPDQQRRVWRCRVGHISRRPDTLLTRFGCACD